jgi:ABC-2 type transport system ATP-binding protein
VAIVERFQASSVSNTSLAVSVRDLHFSYKEQGSREALSGLDLDCKVGKIHALLGPNGSGKSTCFKILSTQLSLQRGHVQILGKDLAKESRKIREEMGVCFQSPSLDPLLTVRENILLQGSLYGLNREEVAVRLKELLEIFDFAERIDARVKSLSGGWARRAELAKALLHKPRLLLLDEPTTGLDPLVRRDFWRELLRLRANGVTMIVSTHLLDEAELCDELSFIHNGKCVASGSLEELRRDAKSDILAFQLSQETASPPESLKGFGEIRATGDGRFELRSDRGAEALETLVREFRTKLVSASLGKSGLADLYYLKTGEKIA